MTIENRDRSVYGVIPPELADTPPDAVQFSPLKPGANRLEDAAGLVSMVMLAPPGTIERRHDIALALRALRPGGLLTVMAPKDKGGARLGKELAGFGCAAEERSLRHHRLLTCARPDHPLRLDEAIEAGAARFVEPLKLWSQPGIFSWDRIDRGSAFLLENLPGALKGRGVDLGCGFGVLAKAALASDTVTALTLVDIDRRAIDAARKNVVDDRASFLWADARQVTLPAEVDFILTNPPFHDGGAEDQALGQAFIRRAAGMLRKGGLCFLIANRHLPYEETLRAAFAHVALRASAGGYKIYEARA